MAKTTKGVKCVDKPTVTKRYNINHKHEKIISALLSCPNVKTAAKESGVHEASIYRLLNENPTFVERYNECKNEVLRSLITRLQAASHQALNFLVATVNNEKSKEHNRVAAARCILEISLKGTEVSKLQEIETRLQEIESGGRYRVG
jgi:hypothetical protein